MLAVERAGLTRLNRFLAGGESQPGDVVNGLIAQIRFGRARADRTVAAAGPQAEFGDNREACPKKRSDLR